MADPITLYDHPENRFVAGFIGSPPMNFMEGKIIKKEGRFFFDEGRFQVKIVEEMYEKVSGFEGREIVFGIRPENIHDKLFIPDALPENIIKATVEVVEPMGSEVFLYLNTGIHNFIARVDAHDQAQVNEELELVLNMAKAHFFEKESGKAIS